jgi:hypothetical protein
VKVALAVMLSAWAACETGQRDAMATEALPREGPRTERLSDGIKVWDTSGRYYTTFRYC